MKTLTKTLKTLAALAFALSPTVALARPTHGPTAHMRPNLFHDRNRQVHDRGSLAHH